MSSIDIDDFVAPECTISHEVSDYEADTPRWCKGCGDHGVLMVVQQLLSDHSMDPENVVAVSGIGCSSRLPHYLKTYGFHGIHGRALPLSLGVSLARPDLKIIAVMGDGDCFSIGSAHWLHTLRYNPDMLVLVLDNEVYALTKNQVSPTTPQGTVTNTSPRGSYLKALNPPSVMLGISNVSFLAQTTTLNPPHLEATIRRAWEHRGLSFVRVLQRCPVFMPEMTFGALAIRYLEHVDGIPLEAATVRGAPVEAHDPRNLSAAREVAAIEDPAPMGLLYWDPEVPTYNEVRHSKRRDVSPAELVTALEKRLDRFAVGRAE